jgi:membrane protease YdiL (CAAX protease family)
MIGILIAIAIS